jgi:hypothetical protein
LPDWSVAVSSTLNRPGPDNGSGGRALLASTTCAAGVQLSETTAVLEQVWNLNADSLRLRNDGDEATRAPAKAACHRRP